MYFYSWHFSLGRHTAQNILEQFDEVLVEFGLTGKVKAIISDNAANMAKAFSVSFPTDEGSQESLLVDEEDMWVRFGFNSTLAL